MEHKVPRLRKTIRFARRFASLGMTMWSRFLRLRRRVQFCHPERGSSFCFARDDNVARFRNL
jgi:hypothetical protein